MPPATVLRTFALATALALGSVATVAVGRAELTPASGPLDALAFEDPRLMAATDTAPFAAEVAAPGMGAAWAAFQARAGSAWRAVLDPRSGLLASAEGVGIPWLLAAAPAGDDRATLAALEARARLELVSLAAAFGLTPADRLLLAAGRSGRMGDAGWNLDFDLERDGLPVEGARIVFRLNHGNLIQLGAEGLPAPGLPTPRPALDAAAARLAAARYLQNNDLPLAPDRLSLVPIRLADSSAASGFIAGRGRGLAVVWSFRFSRPKEPGTWQLRVDAASGVVLALRNLNLDGDARGGAYLVSPEVGGQQTLPMPWADVGNGQFANGAGHHTATGFTSHLDGPYVRVLDTCGAIGLAADWRGDVDFGSSPGSDCSTPGFGGSGNTAAARTQYYQVNRAKESARAWLPDNDWLNQSLTVNVNLPQTCNAYWNGSTLNFFRSGAGCANTGEIAAVALHEYGHGLDTYDGSEPVGERSTGETYGDFTSALLLHRSCIGPGFRAVSCGGNGDACTDCTGVRDIDWAKHVSNTPATVPGFVQPLCPYSPTGYYGVCGQEGHCESYVGSEALWDVANRDLPDPASAGAWATTERLWYLSRATATGAFACTPSEPVWSADGCNIGSLWKTFRAADDDDGNLANGTPHSCQLFAAFDRHGIACASDPGANLCASACTPPASPSLTTTAGRLKVAVTWSDAGTGTTYDVYRSELSCDAGLIRVAANRPTTSWEDGVVAAGQTYFYRVIAHAAGDAGCAAPPSACQSAVPNAPFCAPPATPGNLVATVTGLNQVALTWSAVPDADGYNLYRSIDGGPVTLIATADATSHLDRYLTPGSSLVYTVRAHADGCESTAASDPASAQLAACGNTLVARQIFAAPPDPPWSVGRLGGAGSNEWRGQQECDGSGVFRYGGVACTDDYSDLQHVWAAAPAIPIPAASGATRLTLYHRFAFEPDWDGGRIAIRLPGGPLVYADATAIVSGLGYNGALRQGAPSAPPEGTPIFTGTQADVVSSVIDLDRTCDLATGGTTGCAGLAIEPAFVAMSDTSVTADGWFLDRLDVTACRSDVGLGKDGFESGNLDGWTDFAP
jgi:hypothetical protein